MPESVPVSAAFSPDAVNAGAADTPRILVADQSLPNRRLISEILTSFHRCEVDAAASGENAFERATLSSYKLFIFSFQFPDISGLLLDRLIARIYPRLHPAHATAPPVIFLVQPGDATAFQQAQRDARTRGSIPLPLNLETLMTLVSPLLPPR